MKYPTGQVSIPSLVDLHVHFREPGFSYKETILTGSCAAAASGYSDVFTMPNLSPVPDSVDNLRVQTDIIRRDAKIGVHPYGAITKGQKGEGELVDIESMHTLVAGFSDDGRGIQDKALMREAMCRCKEVGSMLVEHCEVERLVMGGVIHEGAYAREHGYKGISSESEWREVERNIDLVADTGCRLHLCHISTHESVALIREAKKSRLPITAETAPHYLLLTDSDIHEDGAWKMNPPLRTAADRDALIEALGDGTIDCVATDHAPHTAEEKSRGLEYSAFGIVGLETAFPLLYTYLVKKGLLSWDALIDAMSARPRAIMGLNEEGCLATFDLDTTYTIDPSSFRSKGHATPFAGWEVCGRCISNQYQGRTVFTLEQ